MLYYILSPTKTKCLLLGQDLFQCA